ncbi:MAG: polysaccharide biosynthesis protein PslG [Solirubrobacteraceae bacterium]|nr:polysaccharide biosynthesis protein PslG [Solirubrobacteraceae bacterium]
MLASTFTSLSARITRGALAALVAAGCIAFAGAGTAQAAPVMGFTDDWGGNPALLAKSRTVGASAARLYVCWCAIESNQGRLDWFGVDAAYRGMQATGLKPLIVAVGSPTWAGGGGGASPPNARYDANWQAFVRTLAQRYGGAMGIEIWNEPNFGVSFGGKADPVRFTQLLKGAYAAIKGVAPSMPVISGGLAGTRYVDSGGMPDDEFLRAMYKNGAKNAMDAIGDHFYPSGHPLVFGMRGDLDRLRGVRNSQGDSGKPIWVTEFGLSTIQWPGHELVPEWEQGPGLAAMYCVFARSSDIPVVMPYRLQDTGGTGLGIFRADGSAKPAVEVLRNAVLNGSCPAAGGVQVSASKNPVAPGEYVKFTASGFSGTADYRWDTDGSGGFETGSGSSPTVGRTYRTPGVYNVTVKASDNLESYFSSVKVQVGGNKKPVPVLTLLPGGTVKRRTRVTFTGKNSYAPFARVRNWQWDIQKADGRSHHYSARSLSFAFPKVGRFKVRLTVTDTMGKKGSVTRFLSVVKKLPRAKRSRGR